MQRFFAFLGDVMTGAECFYSQVAHGFYRLAGITNDTAEEDAEEDAEENAEENEESVDVCPIDKIYLEVVSTRIQEAFELVIEKALELTDARRIEDKARIELLKGEIQIAMGVVETLHKMYHSGVWQGMGHAESKNKEKIMN